MMGDAKRYRKMNEYYKVFSKKYEAQIAERYKKVLHDLAEMLNKDLDEYGYEVDEAMTFEKNVLKDIYAIYDLERLIIEYKDNLGAIVPDYMKKSPNPTMMFAGMHRNLCQEEGVERESR